MRAGDVAVQASQMVWLVAGPPLNGEPKKSLIVRAAQRLGWNVSRTKKIAYCEARVRVEEWETLKNIAPDMERVRLAIHDLDRQAAELYRPQDRADMRPLGEGRRVAIPQADRPRQAPAPSQGKR